MLIFLFDFWFYKLMDISSNYDDTKAFPRHIYSDNVAQTGFLVSLTGAYVVLLLALPTLPLFWNPHTQVLVDDGFLPL